MQELYVFYKVNGRFLFYRKLIRNNHYDRYYDILHLKQFFKKQWCFSKLFFTVFSIFKVIVFYKSTEFGFEFEMRIPIVKS